MQYTKCDVCNNIETDYSTLHLMIGMLGTPKFEHLCQVCSYWLLKTLDERRKTYGGNFK